MTNVWNVRFRGAPSPAVVRALREEAVVAGPLPIAELWSTRSGRRAPDGGPGAVPWIWLPGGSIDPGALREAVRRGAYDVFTGPPRALARRVRARCEGLAGTAPAAPTSDLFVGESPAARALLGEVHRAARTAMPVLFTGETGTGKDV